MSDASGIDVLGRTPSGLFIVTHAGERQNHGFLASWVMQCGFHPPTITIAIKQDRPILRDLKPGKILCVNLLGKDDTGKKLMGAFARGFGIGEDAFAGQAMAESPNKGRYLTDALGYMECKMTRLLEPSTEHNLVVAQVTGGNMLGDGEPWVHIRKSGANY
ncbi:MAG: flavin reductase family protein [Planctomycetes bacterium]|nr:flavin reductase family protein [Planctomycetota bacterium]NUQ33631.1 flavin reductase [Planctomycetaceae bacterium]